MKIAHAQNYTFASPNIQAGASACKRAVFLLTFKKRINFKLKSEK